MNIKLRESMAGERFSFMPRQVIQCSEAAGNRLIEHGVGFKVGNDVEADGVLPDPTPAEIAAAREKRARRSAGTRETATAPAAERPEGRGAASATCQGRTTSGNACLKKPVPGSEFCAKHGG